MSNTNFMTKKDEHFVNENKEKKPSEMSEQERQQKLRDLFLEYRIYLNELQRRVLNEPEKKKI